MRRLLLLAAFALALGGCASLEAWTRGTNLGEFYRGRTVFETKCAGCHSVHTKRLGAGRGPTAFDEIAQRYSDRSLDREIEVISTFGHYAMPAVPIDPHDRADLVAYIASLRR